MQLTNTKFNRWLVFGFIVVLAVLFVTSAARAQERQIGVGFSKTFYPDLEVKNPTTGFWLDTAQPIGGYVVLNSKFAYERFRVTDDGEYYEEGYPGSNTNLEADVRYYPFGYKHINPFASSGLSFQHSILDFGEYKHKVNFLNPTIGAGVNVHNLVIGQYRYFFGDFLSPYNANGHYLNLDLYYPLGKSSWRGRAAFEFSRRGLQGDYSSNVYKASLGVSKTF